MRFLLRKGVRCAAPRFTLPVVGLALLSLFASAANAVDLAPCELSANEGRNEVAARCGVVSVPLDYERPDGERIDLAVAVVDALADDPAPEPLVVVAGGPGQAATDFFALSEAAFRRILRYRGVLLVDQRGTGDSAALHCEGLEDSSLGDGETDVESLAALAIDCLRTLEHDPRFFTTSVAVRDLDLVRAALGYERLTLYGISYGTRVVQHYARRFPEHVRSMVLDGVVPPTVSLGPDAALDSQAALDAVFQRCQDDAPCAEAFPNLREQFRAALERLREQPTTVAFAHPRTGEEVDMAIDHLTLAGVVRLLVYSPITASLLPPLIEAVHASDYAKLAAQAYTASEAVRGIATGLNYAVLCTEDHPFWGDVDFAAQRATYMGDTLVELSARVCEVWPAGPIDDDFKSPLTSAAPTLLLSGELDPITPPRYADLAAADLGNVLHVVGRGQGHGMVMVPCMRRIIAEFVEVADDASNVNALDLDLSCLERLRPFPLFASPLGPGP